MELEGIDHVALGVRDIERSVKWYIEVLGFERLHEGVWDGVPTFIGKGNTGIALFPANPTAMRSRSRLTKSPNRLDLSCRAEAPAKPRLHAKAGDISRYFKTVRDSPT